jgi:Xaa-Pro aminopeptidase
MHAPDRSADRARRLAGRIEVIGLSALLLTDEADIRWVTGFSGSAGAVLVTRDGAWALATDDRYSDHVRAEAPHADLLVTRTPVTDLAARVGAGRNGPLGVIAADVSLAAWRELVETCGEDGLAALDDLPALERATKDDAEISSISSACRITDAAFVELLAVLRPGFEERSVARTIVNLLLEHGADDVAFPPIVAAGPNAAVPHHQPSRRRLQHGDVVLIDMGARLDGYCADMTRTVALGEVAPELREAHDAVRAAAEAARAAVRPGVIAETVHEAADEVLRQAGLGGARRHATGHGVGLEVHEPPILQAGRDATLGESFTVTIEPGAYLPGLGGVRIEDLVLVGASGAEPLTHQSRSLITL